ncbi:MAG: winged helix-turn-helix transcriptional regulator, partial [Myxococcales bacterium]|nr:winged helix-turn-helix transcriptional regulator [Myxococcales bacterium]
MGERPIFDHLSLLAEPVRVRMLRILAMEELTVNELVAVVQLPQSSVSRQLKVLSELGWIVRRQDANTTRVRFAGDALEEGAARLWDVVGDDPADAAAIAEDRAR